MVSRAGCATRVMVLMGRLYASGAGVARVGYSHPLDGRRTAGKWSEKWEQRSLWGIYRSVAVYTVRLRSYHKLTDLSWKTMMLKSHIILFYSSVVILS